MKKLIAKVFGVEMYANARNIRGKKSSGVEDTGGGFKYWKYTSCWKDANGNIWPDFN